MTQEEKELLLKDICARLPYKPQVEIIKDGTSIIDKLTTATIKYLEGGYWDVKPYLFPLSSMTEEQRKELEELGLGYYVTCQDIDDDGYMWDEKVFQIIPSTETDDWMNAHHFDYRGLIEKSLAIDCTNLNIY